MKGEALEPRRNSIFGAVLGSLGTHAAHNITRTNSLYHMRPYGRITTKSIHMRLVVVFMVFRSSLFRARSSSSCVTSSMFSNGHLFPVSGCDPMSSVVLPRPHFPAPQKYLSLLLSPPPSLTPDACEQMCFVTFDELLVLPSSLCQPC